MFLTVLGAVAFNSQFLISFLIALIILAIILYAVKIVLGLIQLPPGVQQLVWLVIAVIVLIFLLGYLGQAL